MVASASKKKRKRVQEVKNNNQRKGCTLHERLALWPQFSLPRFSGSCFRAFFHADNNHHQSCFKGLLWFQQDLERIPRVLFASLNNGKDKGIEVKVKAREDYKECENASSSREEEHDKSLLEKVQWPHLHSRETSWESEKKYVQLMEIKSWSKGTKNAIWLK